MEPILVLGAVAAFGIALGLARRRVATSQGRFGWVVYAPGLLIYLAGVWAGIRMVIANPMMGAIVVAVTTMTMLLLVRMLLHGPPTIEGLDANGDMPRPAFDYLVWSVLGAPLILAGLLLVLALSGRLSGR